MQYFGTDGIRDAVTGPLLATDFVRRVGAAAAQWLRQEHGMRPLHVVIGQDTRESGGALLFALAQGFATQGVKVFEAGVVPTPAIARAVIDLDLEMGVVLTASHNPATDNGIKFFGRGGMKFSTLVEREIEELIDAQPSYSGVNAHPPVQMYDARRHYLEFIRSTVPVGINFPWKLVVDCANGATFQTTPEILRDLGADLELIGVRPDGTNINAGLGSEHPQKLSELVVKRGAALGIAHDGDGDRLILVDETGAVLDGDAVMAILALHEARAGRLEPRCVVGTVMCNAGLSALLSAEKIELLRADVGDRNVFEMMREQQSMLGGESSGHFIVRKYLPSGDGLLTALQVLRVMCETGKSLSLLASEFKPWPQLKRNLRVAEKIPLEELPELQKAMSAVEKALPEGGRILVRYSGTEPRIRLLVEAGDEAVAQEGMQALEKAVREALECI